MPILDSFNLAGKTALVSGCAHGIGYALTMALAEAGADILGVSRTIEDKGSPLEKDVTAQGRKFHAYRCDFSDRDALHSFIKQVKAENSRIDILVNNAGMSIRKEAAGYPDEDWDKVIEVNLNSHFVMSREIAQDMIARRSGKIIFTASMLSFSGGVEVPPYAASKGGIAQLAKALANEWAQYNVNVNAIAPGYIETRLTRALVEDPERNRTLLDRLPVGRWGVPDDLKGAVVFLASAASDYVHGTVLPVDGGFLAR